MNLNIYSIYDEAAQAYMTPFFMHNDQLAIRAFSNQTTGETQIANHPEQFILFKIGSYNDKDASIETTQIKSLGRAIEHRIPSNDQNAQILQKLEDILINTNHTNRKL